MLFKVKLNHYQCVYPPLDVKEHSNIGLEWLEVLAVLPPDSECEVARYVCRHPDGISHINVSELEWEIADQIYVDWEQSDEKLRAEQEAFLQPFKKTCDKTPTGPQRGRADDDGQHVGGRPQAMGPSKVPPGRVHPFRSISRDPS